MAAPEKPSRLGRGLDALLARRETPKPMAPSGSQTPAEITPESATELVLSTAGSDTNTAEPTMAVTAGHSPSDQSTAQGAREGASEKLQPPYTPSVDANEHSFAFQSPTYAVPVDALTSTPDSHTLGYRLLPIPHIAPNPFQPRKEFHPQDLADLESSLKSQGLLQPITVRPSPNHSGYELIAGERRLRAATRLGWKVIPAIVRETNDRTMLTLAMVENLQRADLDPIEEADGYQRLIDDFNATQQEVADVVGKERSTVANALRLLALPASVKRMLQERKITVGHARALLPLETERAMSDLARDIVAKSLSVRDVEGRVRSTRPSPAKSGRKAKPADSGVSAGSPAASAELRRVEELLRKKMQTSVNVHLTGKERGEVRIAFFSNDDLERVLQLLGVQLDT